MVDALYVRIVGPDTVNAFVVPRVMKHVVERMLEACPVESMRRVLLYTLV
jgi:hypothetical protein